MDRAYSILETKSMDEDEDKFYVKGMASTPTPDRMKDIVEPLGAKFQTPMPLLLQHNHEKPVGHMTLASPSKKGIPFEAEIPKVKEEGVIKQRVDEAIHSLKYKLISAVSIGFKPIEYSYLDDGGVHFSEWEWIELSLVTIPANSEAVIHAVKSIDQKAIAALGIKADDRDYLLPRDRGQQRARRPIQLIPAKRY